MINLYRILFPIPFLFAMSILSIFSKKIRAGFFEKLGFYNFKIDEKTFWIHTVSVGEVQAVTEFIKNYKDEKIVLTVSTPQGLELAKKKLSDYCEKICYFPYDIDFAINSAKRAINPAKVMIFETEIWPNFVYNMKKAGIKVFISNGRISDSTYKTYKTLSFFFKSVFKNFTGVLAQSEEDAKKFISIGANSEIVQNMGNIKFDIKFPSDETALVLNKEYNKGNLPTILAGSTHAGEDEIIISAYKNLKNKIQNLKLIIAPRHLERVNSICTFLESEKLNYNLRTTSPDLEKTDVVVLNTTGELSKLYSVSDVSIICGSFNNTGGHNPLEATIWSKPVISGPNIKNFKVIYRELLKYNCAIIVQDKQELEAELEKILTDGKCQEEMKQNSKKAILENQGATEFLRNYIKGL